MSTLNDWLRQEKRRLALRLINGQLPVQTDIQRYAEFGRVSAGLLHEISTPLTAAVLTIDQLKSEQPSMLLRQVRQDLKQLERYVLAARKQLKNASRQTSFSLSVVIHQVVRLLEARAQANSIELAIGCVGNIHLYGDPIKLHQALANLINNAIEAYDGVNSKQRIVKVEVSSRNSLVDIMVTDYGRGIKQKDLTRIFDPFFSTKKEIGRGIGIGLATVKHNVEQEFGGQITVSSSYMRDTCFRISLPVKARK